MLRQQVYFLRFSLTFLLIFGFSSIGIAQSQLAGNHQLKVGYKISQNKFIAGEKQNFFIQLDIDTPNLLKDLKDEKQPVDLVLVLDRSGSMASESKLVFAKKAVETFIEHLSDKDRISLVAFDGTASTYWPLWNVSKQNKRKMLKILHKITDGGATNMFSGIELGKIAFNNKMKQKKIILLSDGMANAGVTSENEFKRLVKRCLDGQITISTIGMGVDFNEKLLGMIADRGMGNYTFVENTSDLFVTLEKDLDDSRKMFASGAYITITLPNSLFVIRNSPFYEVESLGKNQYRLNVGGLAMNSIKSVMIGMSVAKQQRIATLDMPKIELNYTQGVAKHRQPVRSNRRALGFLAKHKTKQVKQSIDKELFANGWREFESALLNGEVSIAIRKGSSKKARNKVNDYKREVRKIEDTMSVVISNKKLNEELVELEADIHDSEIGTQQEKERKYKKYSKKNHYKARGKVKWSKGK